MANAATRKYLNSTDYEEIKNDLLDQLDRNGTAGKHYVDLVSDYMDMWVTKCLLVDDIQKRGVSVEYDNGGGQKGQEEKRQRGTADKSQCANVKITI